MAVIQMGVDFQEAQAEAEAEMSPAPAGIYEVQVNGYDASGKTRAGQARIKFDLSIINAEVPEFNGKKMSYFANLPDGGNLKGVGFLIAFLEAFGAEWKGTSFDPDEVVGKSASANVSVSDDGKWNNIASFVE